MILRVNNRKFQINQRKILIDLAGIYRKYDIGDKDKFIKDVQQLRKVDTGILENIWTNGTANIRNADIVKDAKDLSLQDIEFCNYKCDQILQGDLDVRHLLFSSFDPKKFKLGDENKKRRIRNILALKFSSQLLEEYKFSVDKEKVDYFILLKIYLIIANVIFLGVIIASLAVFYSDYFNARSAAREWRRNGISKSPIVCLTSSGRRYHRCYHYGRRNYKISLFEAVIDKKKTPCGTCMPPFIDFGKEPKSKFPNPFLISFISVWVGVCGNRQGKKMIDNKVRQLF